MAVAKQGFLHILLPNNTFQFFLGDRDAFPGQMRFIISSVGSGSARGFRLVGHAWKTSKLRCPGGILTIEPLQLAPFLEKSSPSARPSSLKMNIISCCVKQILICFDMFLTKKSVKCKKIIFVPRISFLYFFLNSVNVSVTVEVSRQCFICTTKSWYLIPRAEVFIFHSGMEKLRDCSSVVRLE